MSKEDLILKKLLLFLVVLIIVSVVLNVIWEYGQCGMFYSINGVVSFENYDLLIARLILDIIMTLGTFLLLTIINFEWRWFTDWDSKDTAIIMLFGLLISFYVEVNSLMVGRWSYSESMPILYGTNIGVVSMLQWLILLPLSIYITKYLLRNKIQSVKRYSF